MHNNRWKNPGLYLSLFAIAYLLVQAFGYDVDTNKFEVIVSLGMGILGYAGVISNPKEGRFYFDSKHQPHVEMSNEESAVQVTSEPVDTIEKENLV